MTPVAPDQAASIAGFRYAGSIRPVDVAFPGESTLRSEPSPAYIAVRPNPGAARISATAAAYPLGLRRPVRRVLPSRPVTDTSCGIANWSTCDELSHRPPAS